MFLELSMQESSDQYECRILKQNDGSSDILPVIAADSEVKIRAFISWHLRFAKNANSGLCDQN